MTKTHKSKPRTFEASDALRRQVETLAAFGVPQEDICLLLINPRTSKPIGLKTLRKYFRQELDVGATKATAKVVESLYRQAVGAPAHYDAQGRLVRAERAPVLSAAIFWIKTRAKLDESARAQSGEDADASAPVNTDRLDHDV